MQWMEACLSLLTDGSEVVEVSFVTRIPQPRSSWRRRKEATGQVHVIGLGAVTTGILAFALQKRQSDSRSMNLPQGDEQCRCYRRFRFDQQSWDSPRICANSCTCCSVPDEPWLVSRREIERVNLS